MSHHPVTPDTDLDVALGRDLRIWRDLMKTIRTLACALTMLGGVLISTPVAAGGGDSSPGINEYFVEASNGGFAYIQAGSTMTIDADFEENNGAWTIGVGATAETDRVIFWFNNEVVDVVERSNPAFPTFTLDNPEDGSYGLDLSPGVYEVDVWALGEGESVPMAEALEDGAPTMMAITIVVEGSRFKPGVVATELTIERDDRDGRNDRELMVSLRPR